MLVFFSLSFPGGYWTSDKKIPACTLPEALTYLLDITTPPSQQLLKNLSQLVTAEADRQRLEVLSQVSARAGFVDAAPAAALSHPCSNGAWVLPLCDMFCVLVKPAGARVGLWLSLAVGTKRFLQICCFLCDSGWVISPASLISCLPRGGFW